MVCSAECLSCGGMSLSAPQNPQANPQTHPLFDPIFVVATCRGTAAIWQVETDPAVTIGDFSGAWLITPHGIQGFAASAEWIPERTNQAAMLRTLLVYPVLPAVGTSPEEIKVLLGEGDGGKQEAQEDVNVVGAVTFLDSENLQKAAEGSITAAQKRFAELAPGKKQPAWGKIEPLQPIAAPTPQGHSEEASRAISSAMHMARGLRVWLRQWQAFDKVRVRRLGPLDASYSKAQPAPLTSIT